MTEIWTPIKGYEGLYEVSTHGRVRSLDYLHTGQTKVLSLCKDRGGYLFVNLHKKGKRKSYLVHRLVAEAFLTNWFDDIEVNHIDEDKTNNHIDNLEWCDHKYNCNHGTRNDRLVEKLTNGKLSKIVLQFSKTRELIKEWSSAKEAERNGFNQGAVSACCRGERQTHKGYIWKYKEVV